MPDGELVNGVWVPPGATLGQRFSQDVAEEAERLADWCRRWPRLGEPQLGTGDVVDLVLMHAKMHCWDRERAQAVVAAVNDLLGLIPERQAKRNRKKIHVHAWRDRAARFLTCTICNLVMAREQVFPSAADPVGQEGDQTRVGRSTEDGRAILVDVEDERVAIAKQPRNERGEKAPT